MRFDNLHHLLRQTPLLFQQRIAGAMSQSLVVRNWLIGHYLLEFEQKGLFAFQSWFLADFDGCFIIVLLFYT